MSISLVHKPACLASGLPRVSLIEASAGTGKTWTIERVVVDLLITHRIPLQQILLVTFTRKAAAEMAERIRACIDGMLRAPVPPPAGEPAWIVDDDARARLLDALANFDQASISTIHSFCQRVLDEQVVLAGLVRDPSSTDVPALLHDAFVDHLRVIARTDNDARTFLREWRMLGGTVEAIEDLVRGALPLVVDTGRPLDGFEQRIDDALLHRVQGELRRAFTAPLPGVDELAGRFHRATRLDTLVARLRDVQVLLEDARISALPPRAQQLHILDAMHWLVAGAPAPFVAPEPAQSKAHALLASLRSCYLAGPTSEALALATFFTPTMASFSAAATRRGVTDHQRVLTDTRDALRADAGVGALHARLRARFRAVLVDEFQDTDEVQWEILRRLFVDAPSDARVIVVGDPKQAIYSFRGGDLQTYVAARATISAIDVSSTSIKLTGNRRSTQQMVDAYNAILLAAAKPAGAFFGDAACGVTYDAASAVHAAGQVGELRDDVRNDIVAPLGLVHIDDDLEPDGELAIMRAFVRAAARLVGEPHSLPDRRGGRRRVLPSDLMFLVNTNGSARAYVDALQAAGIPAEQYRADKLLRSDEARDFVDVLEGLAHPQGRAAFVKVLRGVFFRVPFDELEQHKAMPQHDERVRTWRRWILLAQRRAWHSLFADMRRAARVARRASLSPDGERSWLAVQALLDVLHRMARDGCADVEALARRLRAHVDGEPTAGDLDEDDDTYPSSAEGRAARVLTVFKAKGLEAPVVFCALVPTPQGKPSPFHVFHDDDAAGLGRRVHWVGSTSAAPCASTIADEKEQEQRRIQYVALTRASHRLWLPLVTKAHKKKDGTLTGKRVAATVGRRYDAINSRLLALSETPSFSSLVERIDGPFTTIEAGPPVDPLPSPPPPVRVDIDAEPVRADARGLQLGSYTSLSGTLNAALSPDAKKPAPVEVGPDQMPRGARAGDVMHRLIEAVPLSSVRSGQDFATWRADPDVQRACDALWEHNLWTPTQRDDTERIAHAALHTPITLSPGVVVDGLGTLGRAFVREVPFRMTWPTTRQPLGRLVLGRWHVERGHLKGAIDFAFEHDGRVWFGDWKSNAMASYAEPDVAASVRASYESQLRIYTLVLCRLYGIHDEQHYAQRFGGAVYVYARGLASGGGVVVLRPTWQQLQELDAWLATHGEGPPPLPPGPSGASGASFTNDVENVSAPASGDDVPEQDEDLAPRALDERDSDAAIDLDVDDEPEPR